MTENGKVSPFLWARKITLKSPTNSKFQIGQRIFRQSPYTVQCVQCSVIQSPQSRRRTRAGLLYIGSRAPVNDTRQLVRFGIPPCWTSFAHSPRPSSLHITLLHACGENVLCFVWITFPPYIYRSSPNTKFPPLFCTTVSKYQRPIEKKYVLRSWTPSPRFPHPHPTVLNWPLINHGRYFPFHPECWIQRGRGNVLYWKLVTFAHYNFPWNLFKEQFSF